MDDEIFKDETRRKKDEKIISCGKAKTEIFPSKKINKINEWKKERQQTRGVRYN